MKPLTVLPSGSPSAALSRRRFLQGTGAAALGLAVAQPHPVRGAGANEPITLGWMGCGGRGTWIADLFRGHGGYRIVAAHDYFADRVNAFGDKFDLPAARRHTGLNGYRTMLETQPDAVVIESPPYFHPQHAAAAVEAGCHVYLAKPIAVDVPGCLTVEASGRKATAQNQCFLVDFQTRANASYQKAVRLVKEGMIGRLVSGEATYICGATWGAMAPTLHQDPRDPENQLRAWGLSRVLSGDIITEQNIHALDVACWVLGANPLEAEGTGGEARGLGGTCWDHFSVTYRFPNDFLLTFCSKQYGHGWDDICCRIYGLKGTLDTHYFGAVSVRADDDGFNGGAMKNLYTEGAVNNIATFHDSIRKGDCSNPTVAESVRSNLTTILGRTAAYRGAPLTWEALLAQPDRFEFDTSGLKA